VVFVGEQVHLVKWCPDHGITRALISSSRDWTLRSLAYVKPGTRPLAHAVAESAPCPQACGLCPRHQQHSCVPLLEITPACDLACPDCLTHGCVPGALEVAEARAAVDRLVACEGRLNMLTLTGGEPTAHPRFLEVVDAVRRPEIGILSVSTNGLRLAREPELVEALAEREVVIALQYDGASPEVSRRLRGRADLAERKLRLVDASPR
jgi:7,8-dihydro-6-hydroxymethylpterin dimethyltransferase